MSNLQHPDCLPALTTCDFYSDRFLKTSIKQLYLMCSEFSGHSQFPGGEKTPGGVGRQPVTYLGRILKMSIKQLESRCSEFAASWG